VESVVAVLVAAERLWRRSNHFTGLTSCAAKRRAAISGDAAIDKLQLQVGNQQSALMRTDELLETNDAEIPGFPWRLGGICSS
jgi:hypothetical protein